MYYFLIYIETLIFMTFYVLFLKIQDYLRMVGDSSEWYAENKVHVWQVSKVMRLIEKQYEEYKKKLEKESNND